MNLDCSDKAVADAIAKKVRNIGGGLHYVKAMGVKLEGHAMAMKYCSAAARQTETAWAIWQERPPTKACWMSVSAMP